MRYIAIIASLIAVSAGAHAELLITDQDRQAVLEQHVLDRGAVGDVAQKFHVARLYETGAPYLEVSPSKAADWYRKAALEPALTDAELVLVLRARTALRRLGWPVPKHSSKALETRAKRYDGTNGWKRFLDDFAVSQEQTFRSGHYSEAYQGSLERLALVEAAAELGMPKSARAREYGDHAWYALFADAHEEAMQTGLSGLALDPSQTWIWTNIAHAQLLGGDLSEAMFTYKAYLGERIGVEDTPWEDIIAADFAMMKAAGLPSTHMASILEQMRSKN